MICVARNEERLFEICANAPSLVKRQLPRVTLVNGSFLLMGSLLMHGSWWQLIFYFPVLQNDKYWQLQ
jgi:hypothetical protein